MHRRAIQQLVLISVLLLITACAPAPKKTTESAKGDSSTSSSRKGQPWSGKSLSDWKIVFAEMQDVLDLSDDESQKLKSTFEGHVQKLQAWYQKHGPKIARADRAAIDAYKDRDLQELRKLKNEVVPLKQEVAAMHKAMDKAVSDAITESNRDRWLAHRISSRLFKLAEPLKLSDSQKTRVGELAIETAKRMRNHKTPQPAGLLDLEKRAETQVFDNQQRVKYKDIKSKNKLRSLKTYSSFQPTEK